MLPASCSALPTRIPIAHPHAGVAFVFEFLAWKQSAPIFINAAGRPTSLMRWVGLGSRLSRLTLLPGPLECFCFEETGTTGPAGAAPAQLRCSAAASSAVCLSAVAALFVYLLLLLAGTAPTRPLRPLWSPPALLQVCHVGARHPHHALHSVHDLRLLTQAGKLLLLLLLQKEFVHMMQVCMIPDLSPKQASCCTFCP